MKYVSRAGEKIEHAIEQFKISCEGKICADFGANTGGFVDCMLHYGACKVYAVETGYGVLDWKLRQDERVVVLERTNAMHVELPEKIDVLTVDTSWTRLERVLPNVIANLADDGHIIVLLKPHYEAEASMLRKGKLQEEFIPQILALVKEKIMGLHLQILGECESPIVGEKAKNKEFLLHVVRSNEGQI